MRIRLPSVAVVDNTDAPRKWDDSSKKPSLHRRDGGEPQGVELVSGLEGGLLGGDVYSAVHRLQSHQMGKARFWPRRVILSIP